MGYSRTDWNDIITQVNALLAECDGDPLEEVDECHRWAKSDIEDVHTALVEVCEDNSFEDVPDLWSQAMIDEIQAAIDEGACCEGGSGACPTYETGFESISFDPQTSSDNNAMALWLTHAAEVTGKLSEIDTLGGELCSISASKQDRVDDGEDPAVIDAEIAAKEDEIRSKAGELDTLVDQGWASIGSIAGGSGPQVSFAGPISANIESFNVPYLEVLIGKYRGCESNPLAECRATWNWDRGEFGTPSGISVPGGRYVTTPGRTVPTSAGPTSLGISWQYEV